LLQFFRGVIGKDGNGLFDILDREIEFAFGAITVRANNVGIGRECGIERPEDGKVGVGFIALCLRDISLGTMVIGNREIRLEMDDLAEMFDAFGGLAPVAVAI